MNLNNLKGLDENQAPLNFKRESDIYAFSSSLFYFTILKIIC